MTIEERVAQRLKEKGETLCIAESCTGGLISHRLTNVPGSSKFLKGTLVVYSNEAKTKLLKVPVALIRSHGAVSRSVALAMAQGARKTLKSDIGIAITGIAGPSGGTKSKPVGLTFIALSSPSSSVCTKCFFAGRRIEIKSKSATQALHLLYKFLE